jgi:hypothetical protein
MIRSSYDPPTFLLADANAAWNAEKVAGLSSSDLFDIWYPVVDALGTLSLEMEGVIP